MPRKQMWMVRAGENARFVEEFENRNVIALGWNEIGSLEKYSTRGQLKTAVQLRYSDYSEGKINSTTGQLWRFLDEIKVGHLVLTYDSQRRIYLIGEVISEYRFEPNNYSEEDDEIPLQAHRKSVKWFDKRLKRDSFSTTSKNTLGSVLSLFKLNKDVQVEITKLLSQKEDAPTLPLDTEEITLENIKEDIESKGIEFIKDKLNDLDWEEMQELVAGILRGLGYKTYISPKGSDRGKDITASPDGLGLEDPKIIVEVKHRANAMSAPDIRNFLSILRGTEKGIYVSTGGFTKEARYEAERAERPVTLIDLTMLVNLVIQHYDNFDSETKALVPLKKIYWPM